MVLSSRNNNVVDNTAGVNDPAYNNANAGYGDQTNTTGRHNLRHDAEGAAAGGFAGHEYQKHHDGTGGPGAGTGAAAGAFGGHEFNKHEGRQIGGGTTAGTGAPTGVGNGAGGNNVAAGPGATAGQGPSANSHGGIEADREARHLNRTGKIEKAVGNVLCSTTLKQKGLQKEATAQSMQQQAQHSAAADNLEAEAALHRGHAAGLDAQPNHVVGGGQTAGGGQTTGWDGAQNGPNLFGPSGRY